MAGRPRRNAKVRIKRFPKRTRPDGRIYTCLIWTVPGSGTRTTEPCPPDGYVTPEEAETARMRKEAALLLGVRLSDGTAKPWNVGAIIAEYVSDLGQRVSADSVYLRAETMRLANVEDHIGTVAIDRVTAKKLQHYAMDRARELTRNGETTRSSSIREEIAALRRAWGCTRDLGHPVGDPCDVPDLSALPDDARPERRMTRPEVERLIAAARRDETPGLDSLLAVMAWSGRRPVAIFGLTRADCIRVIDDTLPRRDRLAYFSRDKGGRSRGWAPLAEPAYQALRAWLEESPWSDGFVWRRTHGQPWTSEDLNRPFHRCRARAKLDDVQPYDLRRFACTQILATLRSAKLAMPYTGHRTVASLYRYVYAEQGVAEDAAERIGMERAPLRLVEGVGDE